MTQWLAATPLTAGIEHAQQELLLALTREAAASAAEDDDFREFESARARLEATREWRAACGQAVNKWLETLRSLKAVQARDDRAQAQAEESGEYWPAGGEEDR